MGEKWFAFVKRIHTECKAKNSSCTLKEAMKEASKRKSEWKRDGPVSASSRVSKKSKSSSS